jgi:hypothetical protein
MVKQIGKNKSNNGEKSTKGKNKFNSFKLRSGYPKSKKTEIKFSPLDSKNNYIQVPYTAVKEAIATRIKADGGHGAVEVARLIEAEARINIQRPIMKVSTNIDAIVRAREDAKFAIEFKDDIRRYKDRMQYLNEGLIQAYGMIWSEYMTKEMISRIENLPTYHTVIKDDVILLLKNIKAITHEAARAQCPIITMTDALTKFLTFKQVDGLTLAEYMTSFKEYRDIVKSQMGDRFLDYYVTT